MRDESIKTVVLAVVVAFSLIASAGVAAAGEAAAPAGSPADVQAGDDTQAITGLEVTNTDPGEDGVDVYINVTSLETANVGLDSLNVNITDADVQGATVTDTNVNRNNGNTTVRLTFNVTDDATSFTVERLELVQLQTSDATATEGLTYYVAVSDQERLGNDAPNEDDVESGSFSVATGGEETTTATDSDTSTATDSDTETATATDTEASGDETGDESGSDETGGDDSGGEETPDDSSGDGTGFGAIVALVAVLGAALFVRR